MEKILNKINDIIDTKYDHMFVGNELVSSGNTLKEIKKYVKEQYDAPTKDIKGYIISIKIDKKGKIPLSITCMQVTITPKLFIKSMEDDGVQTFNYSSDAVIKYGFKMSHLKKIMSAIKNDMVSYRKSGVSISEILK